jgi:hypothetical protein
MTMNRGGCGPRCGVRARFADDSEPAIFPRTEGPQLLAPDYSRSFLRIASAVSTWPVPTLQNQDRGKYYPKNVTNGPVTPVLKYSKVDSGCSVPGTHPLTCNF